MRMSATIVCLTVCSQSSMLVFYVPFNSQGDIETGPHHCYLSDSNPHRGGSLQLVAKLANH